MLCYLYLSILIYHPSLSYLQTLYQNENKFLQGNFLIKPLDITDPKNNLNNPPLNLEAQENFLNSGDLPFYLVHQTSL